MYGEQDPGSTLRPEEAHAQRPEVVGIPDPTDSAGEFLLRMQRSGLFSEQELQGLRDEVGRFPDDDVRRLIALLLRRNRLTCWQSDELLAGRTQLKIGSLELREPAGQGSFGQVFQAYDTLRDRVVAAKQLRALSDPNAKARFLREMKIAEQLDHRHIITSYGAEVVEDDYLIVMEYFQSFTLLETVRRQWEPQLAPIGWSCECVRQVALGLAHAHARGIVHRDVKPSNLLVSMSQSRTNPHVKIIDFGLALAYDRADSETRMTNMREVFGTPEYMSPEQAESARNSDIRSDIYSLGITLFRLLTDSLPFAGSTPARQYIARIEEDPPPVSSRRGDVPAGLDALVLKMLARDREDRIQTPAEVVAGLTPYCMSPTEG